MVWEESLPAAESLEAGHLMGYQHLVACFTHLQAVGLGFAFSGNRLFTLVTATASGSHAMVLTYWQRLPVQGWDLRPNWAHCCFFLVKVDVGTEVPSLVSATGI
jgi:hypothetical protein